MEKFQTLETNIDVKKNKCFLFCRFILLILKNLAAVETGNTIIVQKFVVMESFFVKILERYVVKMWWSQYLRE